MLRVSIALPIVLLTSMGVTNGQSLGDVARQTRQKEKARAKAAKVITNEEIPESPMPAPVQSEAAAKADPSSPSDDSPAPHSAVEWKSMITAEKNRIDAMKAQIDKLNESIHFVTANAYVNGAEYNQYQAKKQQQVKNLEKQLEEESKKLADMQEAAKKEGMGAAVYDP